MRRRSSFASLVLASLLVAVAACSSDASDGSLSSGGDGTGGGASNTSSSGGSSNGATPGGSSSGGSGSSSSGSSSSGSSGSSGGSSGSSSGGSSSSGSSSGGGPTTPSSVDGPLHTSGAQILDGANKVVRLTGLSWFGMETSNFAPHGLWTRELGSVLDQIKSLGYNSVRLPYTNQLFDAASVPNGIDLAKNPTLKDKTGLQIMDAVIAEAGKRGLAIILDRHRPDANAQSPLWYTDTVSEQRWIADWTMLATRYKGNKTVIGADLHNEPHATATWGDGNQQTDWRLAAERAGNAILAVNSDLLIFVEGIETAAGQSYWWGGNLRNAGASPVRLSVANRLVYSIHDYPASVYSQPWFTEADYPASLDREWDATWGYLVKQNVAPVWIGEFGTKDQTAIDQTWLKEMVGYIGKGGLSFAFWSLNPDSGDTGGILQDDWQTVQADKQAALKPILSPLP